MAKAFYKMVGGKSRMLPMLREYYPKRFNRYHEPFFGAGSVFFDLEPKSYSISDLNPEVVNAVSCLQGSFDELIKAMGSIESAFLQHPFTSRAGTPRREDTKVLKADQVRSQEDFYYWMRGKHPHGKPRGLDVKRAASFLFLVRTCHGGVWRVNADGKMNCPYGKYKDPRIVDVPTLEAAHLALNPRTGEEANPSSIGLADFRVAVGWNGTMGDRSSLVPMRGDFVYFDPPYDETFADYNPAGFTVLDQCELAEVGKELASKGVHVLVTNSDTELVRKAWSSRAKLFSFHSIKGARSLSRDTTQRGAAGQDIIIASRSLV